MERYGSLLAALDQRLHLIPARSGCPAHPVVRVIDSCTSISILST
jgi:hypothetical protein